MRPALEFEGLLNHLDKQAAPSDGHAWSQVAQEISKLFNVAPDEVALLEIVAPGRGLRFLLPEKLRKMGFIPLTSTTALAARTARLRRPEIINNFSTSPHASVFEGVPLDGRQGQIIQKIMSAPIVREKKVVGVVQVSRKGMSLNDAGPDFAPKDLTQLQELNHLLERALTLCSADGAAVS